MDKTTVWREFTELMRGGNVGLDRIRPYPGLPAETLCGFVRQLREAIVWEALLPPELHTEGAHVHAILAPGSTEQGTLCFTFLVDGDEWWLRHLESIVIRLDKLPDPPVSEFPDIPDEQKTWMREEIAVTEQVRLYRYLVEREGVEAARRWFLDGEGYALAARTWVPLVRLARAFVLYLCWEQTRLRGASATLEELTDSSARVRLAPTFLRLYDSTGHLRHQVHRDDYVALFDAVWQDRARAAGWTLAIERQPAATECVFHLGRGVMPG